MPVGFLNFTTRKPTQKDIECILIAEKLGYKTQLLPNDKIGIWK